MSEQSPTSARADAAQELLARLRQTFVAELPERIEGIESALLKLERGTHYAQDFQELYRRVHSLKGSGGTYGLPIITTVCHQFEDGLSPHHAAAALPPEIVERCLKYVDLLRRTTEALHAGRNTFEDVQEQLDRLQSAILRNRRRCLVVDSSRTTRELCTELARSLDMECVTLTDGYQALARLLLERFDILVCGIEIGMLSGTGLVAAVRLSGGVNRDLRIIVVTSSRRQLPLTDVIRPDCVVEKGATLLAELQNALCASGPAA